MAIKTVSISQGPSLNSNYSYTATIKIPGATSITGIKAQPSVSSNNISYSFNQETEEISITATLPYTREKPKTTKQVPLINSYVSGDRLYCQYTPGHTSSSPYTGQSCSPYIIVTDQPAYYEFVYTLNIEYEGNRPPVLSTSMTDARTLYENDTLAVSGTVQDADSGNVMIVKYSINNAAARTIYTAISDGTAKPFNRVLTFKGGKLFDGDTAVTPSLQEGAQHVLRVWAEDDQGGRSEDIVRTFQVVPNRPPRLSLEPFSKKEGVIDTDTVTVKGTVSDPDANTVKVEYKIGGESFKEVYSGPGGAFSFDIQVSRLSSGDNTLTIRATDSYGATTTKTVTATKAGTVTPLKKGVVTYAINPPNGSATGVIAWVIRDTGDLEATAEISMTGKNEEENWVPMDKAATAYLQGGLEEDQWQYEPQPVAAAEKILIRLTLERANANSAAGIRQISGVLD